MPNDAGSGVQTPVVITGLGLLTPIGCSPWPTLGALRAGSTTADRLTGAPDEVDPTTLALMTGGVSAEIHVAGDPAIELALRAARQAMADAGVEPGSPQASATGLYLASSKGAILTLIEPKLNDARAECLLLGPHGYLASSLQRRLSVGGVWAPVAACATSLIAMGQAIDAVSTGRTPRALVVAVEAALHPMFVHANRNLGVLAPTSPARAHRALPLDRRRCGFTLNECAAAVMIERASDMAPQQNLWGKSLRVASATQPYDLVRAAERFTAVRRVVSAVLDNGAPVALLQPHATGTIDNDERELKALAAALGDRAASTPIYASKGAIGHGLGASGLVNVVLGCLIGRARSRPPMPWLDEPIDSAFTLTADEQPIEPGIHVCVCAGFGGHVGAMSFEPC